MNYRKLIGTRIKQARKDAKFTQLELSKKAFIARSRISEMENGLSPIDVERLAEFAEALDKPIMYFLSDFQNPSNE